MNKKHLMKLIYEGQYIAEVNIDLIEENTGWSPYLSLEDAQKLDEVRQALRRSDLKSAGRLAHVYTLPQLQFNLKRGTCRWRESGIIRCCDMLGGFSKTRLQLVLYRIFSV